MKEIIEMNLYIYIIIIIINIKLLKSNYKYLFMNIIKLNIFYNLTIIDLILYNKNLKNLAIGRFELPLRACEARVLTTIRYHFYNIKAKIKII